MSLTPEQFNALIARSFAGALDDFSALAVGVSGGVDSMALLWLLQRWCADHSKVLHVLSVDHGLRDEAASECAMVARYCEVFDHVNHEILKWDIPSDKRVQEEARKARYALMGAYCKVHSIQHLFLAHHEGDQAETVLFRLAKGSGLDGLAGMRAVQNMDNVTLCRPLLNVAKGDLIALCAREDIPFIDDPSNEDDQYARVRLRRSMNVLAEEGLTPKRLAVTARRIARARDALDEVADRAYEEHLLNKNTDRFEFNNNLAREHSETLLRVVLKVIEYIGFDRDYAPRMEKVEDLVDALQNDLSFRKRTLGGVVFERDDQNQMLIFSRETTSKNSDP